MFQEIFCSYTLLLFRILHIYLPVWFLDFIRILAFSLLPIITFQGETSGDGKVAKKSPGREKRGPQRVVLETHPEAVAVSTIMAAAK